jgi:hypothetical protein
MRPFVQLLAAWIKRSQGGEVSALLDQALADEIEAARGKPDLGKLAKKAAVAVTERLLHRSTSGAEFLAWLDDVMERVGEQASRAALETLAPDRVYLESEDPLVVSARYVGDTQDPDTEVPAHLSHRDLVRVLTEMGGKASCDWLIREVDAGFGRELRTVYSCRSVFPVAKLASALFGQAVVESAAARALSARSARSGARKKTPMELDREIASVLAARRGDRAQRGPRSR